MIHMIKSMKCLCVRVSVCVRICVCVCVCLCVCISVCVRVYAKSCEIGQIYRSYLCLLSDLFY